jgi:general secretion pathway protein G
MPTSESCQNRPPSSSHAGAAGFTLLELLVVLTILGLMAAAVTPDLASMYGRLDFNLARETFEQRINNLSYEAYGANTDLVLKPTTQRGVDALEAMGPSAADVMSQEITVPVPADWEIYIDRPIVFRASGFCSGGALSVKVGEFVANYVLHPPYCQAEEVP